MSPTRLPHEHAAHEVLRHGPFPWAAGLLRAVVAIRRRVRQAARSVEVHDPMSLLTSADRAGHLTVETLGVL